MGQNKVSFARLAAAANKNIKEKNYWLKQLAGEWAKSGFHYDSEITGKNERLMETAGFEITGRDFDMLMKLSSGSDTRLYMILTAALFVLVNKYTGSEDIILGTPVYKQKNETTLINTVLALRHRFDQPLTFKELLYHVRELVTNAVEHYAYPFELLLEKLGLETSETDDFPLFDTAILLENIHNKDYIRHINVNTCFSFSRKPGRIEAVIEYNAFLYSKAAVERIGRHFKNLLQEMLHHVEADISGIDMLSAAERKMLLEDWNATAVTYITDSTLSELFRQQVERTPDRTAVLSEDKELWQLTYKELNARANRLAGFLKSKGVGPGSIVGIMVKPSTEMVVGILGILKAGGAYLPVNPSYPPERARYMLEDSHAALCLVDRDIEIDIDVLYLRPGANYQGSDENPDIPVIPGSPAYVIYTSGSTGRPVGVMVEHRNVLPLLQWFNEKYHLDTHRHVLHMTDVSFDVSVEEIFAALLHGAVVCIPGPTTAQDKDEFVSFMKRHQVNVAQFVPVTLREFIAETGKIDSLQVVICGGDKLDETARDSVIGKGYNLYNHYGPTETTVDAVVCQCSGSKVVIGKPIANMQAYILDSDHNLQPPGVPGELCIGGVGVARGYVNNPTKTHEKFIPFARIIERLPGEYRETLPSTVRHRGDEPIYRTGDMARWLDTGEIEFLGRMDYQVKLRGFRIELEEIEKRLLTLEDVKNAVVMVRGARKTGEFLCGFIVSRRVFPSEELREYLSLKLPDYMIPAKFIQLDQLPVLFNGKVDRRKLGEYEIPSVEQEYRQPRDEIESKMRDIWQEVAGVERLGIDDNFFEIGGDSIKAIQIASRLQKYGLKLEIRDLMLHPTIEAAARYVKVKDHMIDQGAVTGEIPLTPIQHWFFQQAFTDSHHYNQAVVLYREEGFQEENLRNVLEKLTAHHDALRMIYDVQNGRVKQVNRAAAGELFKLEVMDFRGMGNGNLEEEIEKEVNRLQASIDLQAGPLMVLGLFKTLKGDHLAIIIHHLVIDGVSWRILLEDLADGYQQAMVKEKNIEFPGKTDSFQTWSQKLHLYAQGKEALEELDYWKVLEQVETDRLPRDYQISPGMKKHKYRETVGMALGKEQTQQLLNGVNQPYGTFVTDILLTALALALKQWGGCQNILVSLEGHGREDIFPHVEVSRTVGWFTSEYPLLLETHKMGDPAYSIKHVKETVRRIPNGGIGYGILKYVTSADKKGGITFTAAPEISFNYMGQFDQGNGKNTDNTPFTFSHIPAGFQVSPEMEETSVFNISGMTMGGVLSLSFSYNTLEYERETVENLVSIYKTTLLTIIRHCLEKEEKELTPADYNYMDLKLEDLDYFENELSDID